MATKPTPMARSNKVQEAIQGIRNFYAAGKKVPKRAAHKDAYRKGVIEDWAEKLDMNPDTVRKARQFVALYSPEEVKDLCDLCQAEQTEMADKKAVFGPSHVILLLTVADKRRRAGLQRRAIKEGWSTNQLQARIKAKFGTRREGGHPPTVFTDPEDVYAQLETMCMQWLKWVDALYPDEDGPKPPVAFSDLTRAVQEHLSNADECLIQLARAVTAQMRRLNPGRETRKKLRELEEKRRERAAARSKQH